MRIRSRVPDDATGRRLDVLIASFDEIETRALAERLIARGDVLVDGVARAKSYRVEAGELIEVVRPSAPGPLIPESIDIPVVYDDEHLVVVEKRAGLVVHPAAGHETGTLAHGLVALGARGGDDSRPGIVHRLDRDTSGLLLVARSELVLERLQEQIRAREVDRRYLALVRGAPRSRTGRIEAAIGRDRRDRNRYSLDSSTPRAAVTRFETIEPLSERTLLELQLETGRTHQIRVHLEAIGLRVCGDPVYGVAGDLGLPRQFLHAHRLAFRHPVTAARLELSSPLPSDLVTALERARSEAANVGRDVV